MLWPVVFYLVLFPFALSWDPQRQDKFCNKENYFNATEYWEASEKTHRSPNETKRCLQSHFHIALHLVVGGAGKNDLDHSQRTVFDDRSWGLIFVTFHHLRKFTKVGQVWVKLEVFSKWTLVLGVLVCDCVKFALVLQFSQFLEDNIRIETSTAGLAA